MHLHFTEHPIYKIKIYIVLYKRTEVENEEMEKHTFEVDSYVKEEVVVI